jgi:hypothetical protein
MDKLHRIFDDKHERRLAQGILELMSDQDTGKCNGVFYKATDGTFARHIEGTVSRPLTVHYNGTAKAVFDGLIDSGTIAVSEIKVSNGNQQGYKLIRSF